MPKTDETPENIGILIPQFPGQTHIFFWREILELQKMGVNVTLLSTRPPPSGLMSHAWSQEAMARTAYLVDTDPINTARAFARFPLRQLARDLRTEPREFAKDVALSMPAARRLAIACRSAGITHVHAHSARRAATICALAKLAYGLNYSLTLHGPLSDYGPGQRFKWRNAAFGTVITKKLHGQLTQEVGADLPDDLRVQPMGVDTDELRRPAAYRPPQPGETLRLFSCARLNIVKGHQDLMDAVKLLTGRGLDVRLDIAGEDDDGGGGFRGELEAKIRDLGLEHRISLLGAISADEVRDRLLEAHLFVLASWHEPLGVAYMEAMSCGVPTIGTDSGGVPELIRHARDGLLVPPKNPAALADAIQAGAEDGALLSDLSRAGRLRIEEGFSSRQGARVLLDGICQQ